LGFIKQDNQIVEEVMRLGKGLIILVNKWDLIEKETNTMKTFKNNMIYKFPTIQNFPILFVSAKTNQRISNIMKESLNVYDVWKTEFSTSKLNKVLKESVLRYSPPSVRGKNIKIKYATQTGTKPPKIRIFCNFPHLVPMSYKNYLENQFRISLELFGTPVFIKYLKS
jgi:Predicted GTPases